jgi:deoxyadenosine/deoxycytidine kinase
MLKEGPQVEHEPLPRHLRIGMMGAIGAGKSTLAQLLGDRWSVAPITENYQDNKYLPLFYSDPRRWGYESQKFFLESKVSQLTGLDGGSTEILDPAKEMDTDVYLVAIYRMGWMTRRQLAKYRTLHQKLTEGKTLEPDIFVVVRASAQTLLSRIERRIEEDPHRIFERWILNGHQDYVRELVVTLDEWVDDARSKVPIIEISSEFHNFTSESDSEIVVGRIEGTIAQKLAESPRGRAGEILISPSFPHPPHVLDTFPEASSSLVRYPRT